MKKKDDKNIVTIEMTVEEFSQVMDMLSESNSTEGKYGTYEELSKKYEDLWKDYQSILKLLDTANGRLAYQNMMLDKAREAYEYITAEDRDK